MFYKGNRLEIQINLGVKQKHRKLATEAFRYTYLKISTLVYLQTLVK